MMMMAMVKCGDDNGGDPLLQLFSKDLDLTLRPRVNAPLSPFTKVFGLKRETRQSWV
jgi:hypothetical protein